MRISYVLLPFSALLVFLTTQASAQFIDDKPAAAAGGDSLLRNPRTMYLQVGINVQAGGGALKGVAGTAPVPLDWDEQKVRLIGEERTPSVRGLTYRTVGNTTKQMVMAAPMVPANSAAKVLLTFELTRYEIVPPADNSQFRIPDRVEPALRPYLGASPYIETRNVKIRDLAKKLFAAKEGATDWEKVEALYDGVRERVKYVNGKLKGALAALNDGTGDCEEMTSLFIAFCRVNGIPARTVWVPEHCYPEFYLVDKEGQGHWFPCQAAGDRAFGCMPDVRPILQKGDNFIIPDNPKPQRYVAETLRVKDAVGGHKPRVEFICKPVNAPPAANGAPAAAAPAAGPNPF